MALSPETGGSLSEKSISISSDSSASAPSKSARSSCSFIGHHEGHVQFAVPQVQRIILLAGEHSQKRMRSALRLDVVTSQGAVELINRRRQRHVVVRHDRL